MKHRWNRALALILVLALLVAQLAIAEEAIPVAEADQGQLEMEWTAETEEIESAVGETEEILLGDFEEIPAGETPIEVEPAAEDAPQDAEWNGVETWWFIVGDTVVALQEAREGDEILRPEDPAAPEGMVFDGWYLEDGTRLFTEDEPVIAVPSPLTVDVNVYARFVEAEGANEEEAVEEQPVEEPAEEPAEELVEEPAEEPVEEPVVEEPVAEEPAEEEPIAEEPVEEPVAEEPVVEEPVAEEPVDGEPVIEEPVEEPVAEEPVVEEPVAEEPVAEEPVIEEPVEEPVAEEPVIEEPVTEELVVEEPVAEEPIAEEPVAEEPVVEEPVDEEPVIEEPVEEPVAEEPVVEESIAEEPVAEEPVAEEPVVEEPVAEEPVVEEPVVEEPVVEEPVEEEAQDLIPTADSEPTQTDEAQVPTSDEDLTPEMDFTEYANDVDEVISVSASFEKDAPAQAKAQYKALGNVAESTYTLTIPATLDVTGSGWNATDGISATGTLANGKKLTVTAASANSWALKSGDNSVGYNLATATGTYSSSATPASWEFTELTNTATTKPMGIIVEDYSSKPAGTYQDTVTFTAKVEVAKSAAETPSIAQADCTFSPSNGKSTLSNANITTSMEYSADNGTTWTDVTSAGSIASLAAGTVQIRVKETDEKLASEAVSITVPEVLHINELVGPYTGDRLTCEYYAGETWQALVDRYGLIKVYSGRAAFGSDGFIYYENGSAVPVTDLVDNTKTYEVQ